MALVLCATQPWGTLWDTAGNVLVGSQASLADYVTAVAVTHYADADSSSPSTGPMTADANGRLMRWVEEGTYNLTLPGGTVLRAEATSGRAAGDILDQFDGALASSSTSGFSSTLRSPSSIDRAINQLPSRLAYWRFDERSGTTIYDDLRVHDATGITPATALLGKGGLGFSDGRTGIEVSADGTIILVADQGANDTLRLTGKPWSIGWLGRINLLPTSGFAYVARKQANGPGILVNSTGSFVASWNDGGAKDVTSAVSVLQEGAVYLMGAAFDGTTLKLYLNGREVASGAETDAGISSTAQWTMLASTTGTTALKAHTAGIFVCGEALAEPAWDDLWAKCVAKPLYPLGSPGKTFRIPIDGAADLTDPVGDANRYDIIVVQAWRTAYRDAVKAANPECKVICYQEIAAMTAGRDGGSGLSSSLVNYDEAGNDPPTAANAAAGPNATWFLTSIATGLPFTFNAYAFLWAADVGDLAFQARSAKNMRTLLEGSNWDGIFLDDVNPSLNHHHTQSDITEFPTNASYFIAMKSLLSRLVPVAEGLGKLVVGNFPAHEYAPQPDLTVEILGGLDEYALAFPPNTFQSAGTIDRVMYYGLETQRRGHPILVGMAATVTGDTPEVSKARFVMAATLILQEGKAYAGITGEYSARTWSPEWEDLDFLIAPVQRAQRATSGVWSRRFIGGIVYLNPTTGGVALTFPGTYSGSGLTNSTGTTLAAQSALILRQDT